MTFWREAATLIIALRPRLTGCSTKLSSGVSLAADYKVLMLKRSAESSFMPSKLVFPGGMVQDADHSGDWHGVFEKVMGCKLTDASCRSSDIASHFSHNVANNRRLPLDVAYRICAIRETFEESGLLLATRGDRLSYSNEPFIVSSSAGELTKLAADMRSKVEKKPEYFLQMCKDLAAVPDVWALNRWRNWLTPVFRKMSEPPAKPKRFNTMFYMCCIDCDSVPCTSADEAETTQAQWKAPGTFLEDDMNRAADQPPLAPPQIYEMHNLRKFSTLDSLLGDYLYPAQPDYEGTEDTCMLPPLLSSNVKELTNSSCRLNRLLFKNEETVRSLSHIDTTAQDTTAADSLLQKGTVVCNV